MTRRTNSNDGNKAHEDARAAYGTAIDLVIYDGELSWQITGTFVQFSILVIAGAFSPSFIGSSDRATAYLTAFVVSLAGMILTTMFASTVARIRTYEHYWVLRAAQLESYLGKNVRTVGGSMELSRSGSIAVGDQTIRLPRIAAVKSKLMLRALYLSFFLTFLFAAIANATCFVRLPAGQRKTLIQSVFGGKADGLTGAQKQPSQVTKPEVNKGNPSLSASPTP
jgi:hypothetical protein